MDVAAGTGDLSALIYDRIQPEGFLCTTDINATMLQRGRDRLINQGIFERALAVQANAEHLPFRNDTFDGIFIGFGLRNVTDKAAAVRSMARVLRPGGSLTILEFSHLKLDCLRPAYDFYSLKILPKLGQWIANDAESYRYLAESIRRHPDQANLRNLILENGFDRCDVVNLTAGIVAIHRAYKA